MWILALEASTTSAKAMLYDTEDGTFIEKIKTYGRMHENEVLHDADIVFTCMTEVGRDLAAGKDISIVSLSGTWHGVMLCDQEMKPVTPVYPWSYMEAAGLCTKLRGDEIFVKEYYQRTGCMVNATYPLFKLLHLKEQGYHLEHYMIMDQGSYNNYRLTGERVTSRCLASGSGFLNIHTRDYDKESLHLAGIMEHQLPRLVESTKTFPLSKEGSAMLGIPEGIPVVLTNSDGGLNQIGAGAGEEGVMTFSVGTSGAMRISTKEPLIPNEPSTWCYLSPRGWLSGAATAGCCNCIDWFLSSVSLGEKGYDQLEQDSERILDTPIFLPFLFGERCPGWNDERKGGFVNLEVKHTMEDMYRGVQQGILFHLYHCYQLLTKVTGEPERIKISGGILHSKLWTQMCADVFGKRMEITETKQSSLMGAVVLAREIMGDLQGKNDYDSPIVDMVIPNMERNKQYKIQYKKYLRLYKGIA